MQPFENNVTDPKNAPENCLQRKIFYYRLSYYILLQQFWAKNTTENSAAHLRVIRVFYSRFLRKQFIMLTQSIDSNHFYGINYCQSSSIDGNQKAY